MRAAIIMEDDDGRRMVYEIIPEQMHLAPEHESISSWMPQPVLGPIATRIVLEGKLVQGRVWDAPMPAPEQHELHLAPLAVEGVAR